jgi:4'-phosphopantetheinyl transferase
LININYTSLKHTVLIHLLYTYINTEQHSAILKTFLGRFPLSYQQKIKRYRRWQDAQASLLGRLLLSQGLADYYGYQLDFNRLAYGEFGKPYLPDVPLYFNISHSHGLVVCAIQPEVVVGVDIEYIKPVPITDFRSQMTANEWALVSQAADPIAAFYDYWTSKEAILKVEGSGIQLGLKTFEVASDRRTARVKANTWFLQKCEPDPDYCCYVAAASPIVQYPVLQHLNF